MAASIKESIRVNDEWGALIYKELKEHRLEQLRKEIAIGLDQLDRGETIPAQLVFETLRQRSQARRNGGT